MKKITLLLTLLMSTFTFAQYCVNGPTSTADSNVQQVDIAGDAATAISHTGCPGVLGAEDLTVQTVDLTAGTNYTLNVTFGTCGGNYGGAGEVWIDYNQNFTFEAGESVGVSAGTPGTAPWDAAVAFTVNIPVTAINGATRMRIKQEEGGTNPLDPCVDYQWGSVMDFTINVSGGTAPPSCLPPNTLTASGMTPVQADLAWTTGGSGEAMWDVEYGVSPYTPTGVPTSAGTTGVANPFTLTGLTASTTYEYYVRADCGGSTSTWSGPFTFTTACVAFAVPFTETFNSTSTSQDCWNVVNNNGDGDAWDLDYATNPFEGDQVAMMYTDFNAGANDDYLISPGIILTGNQRLKYQYRVQSAGEPNDFELLLSTTGTAPADFSTTLIANTSYDNIAYMEAIVDLSAYTGTVYVAWHVPNGGLDGWRLYVDSVIFEDIPACLQPTALSVTNITDTTVDLGWTSTESAWDIEYGVTPFTATGTPTITNTANNPEGLTGLVQDTEYQYMVRANCGGAGTSTWAGPFTFRTACSAVAAPYMQDFETFTTADTAFTSENCWAANNVAGYFWESAEPADTGSGNTGPATGVNTGNYFYTEASGSTAGSIVELISPLIDESALTTPAIAFSYHMYGSIMGTLHVDVYDGAVWNNDVVSIVGQQQTAEGDAWRQSVTDISGLTITGPIQIRFRGESGGDWESDIAIDNFQVNELPVLGIQDLQLSEGFNFYPNPVTNVLKVSAQSNIENLQIVNMLGQVVKTAQPNLQAYNLDMSSLATGVYFIKATVNNTEGTFRIIKQ